MANNSTNPLISARDHEQHLSWKHLKDHVEYHFELIVPFKAPVNPYADGAYWLITAQVMDDADCNSLSIRKGDLLVVELPTKTFERAWWSVPIHFRKDFSEENNLRLKFVKKTRQSMFIMEVEKLKPAENHLAFAEKVYSHSEQYINAIKKIKKNNSEEY